MFLFLESSDENDGNVVIKAKRARGPQRMVQSVSHFTECIEFNLLFLIYRK
jgi:hypothetical protein